MKILQRKIIKSAANNEAFCKENFTVYQLRWFTFLSSTNQKHKGIVTDLQRKIKFFFELLRIFFDWPIIFHCLFLCKSFSVVIPKVNRFLKSLPFSLSFSNVLIFYQQKWKAFEGICAFALVVKSDASLQCLFINKTVLPLKDRPQQWDKINSYKLGSRVIALLQNVM